MANEANSMIAEGQSKMFTVSVANYSGSKTKPATADSNGLMPVILPSIEGGQLPETARVVTGTVAQRAGLVAGKSYQISVSNGGPRTYPDKATGEERTGTQWNYQVLHELSFKDLREVQEAQNKAFVGTPASKVANPFAS